MNQPELQFVTCVDPAKPQDSHRMAYWQWGQSDAPHVVLCLHGLSRQGRDFDVLAAALCQRAPRLRVICPDVVGRGHSDWLKLPTAYQPATYVADMLQLLGHQHARSPITTLDWVGTSMGGMVGMIACGQPGLPLPLPVRRLVLNDVGPAVEWESVKRIAGYVGKTGRYASVLEAADAMWAISTGFGPHTPEQWLALCRPMLRELPGEPGWLQLHYDPAIAENVRAATEESVAQGSQMLWTLYDQIKADTLLLRGAQSDLLSPAVAADMARRGPRARVVEFQGVGHAPTLVADDQVRVVADFLLGA